MVARRVNVSCGEGKLFRACPRDLVFPTSRDTLLIREKSGNNLPSCLVQPVSRSSPHELAFTYLERHQPAMQRNHFLSRFPFHLPNLILVGCRLAPLPFMPIRLHPDCVLFKRVR